MTVLQGRMADPARPDEVVMSAGAAAEFGLHIGSTLRVAFFTDAQTTAPNFAGYPRDKPHLIVPFKLVGIVEWSPQVVQDDDAALGNGIAVMTPAVNKAARDVLRLLLLRLVSSSRRIGPPRGRRLCREQDHPQPRSRRGNEHERPVRREGRARHPT